MNEDNNYWKHFGEGIDPSKNKYLNPQKVDIVSTPKPNPLLHPPNKGDAKYFVSDAYDTYALGVEAIRSVPLGDADGQPIHQKSSGTNIYRPFTMRETFEVLITDYNTLKDSKGKDRTIDDRLKFFQNWKFTSTGIIYKKHKGGILSKSESDKIKIIPFYEGFAEINTNFKKEFIDTVAYKDINYPEIDTSKNKYDTSLTLTELLNHPAWLNAVGDDKDGKKLLEEMFKITTARTGNSTAMGFYKVDNPSTDQLRALYVGSIDSNSSADGDSNLNSNARFLQVAQVKKNST